MLNVHSVKTLGETMTDQNPPAVWGLWHPRRGFLLSDMHNVITYFCEDDAASHVVVDPGYRPVQLVPAGSELEKVFFLIDFDIGCCQARAKSAECDTVKLLALDSARTLRLLRSKIEAVTNPPTPAGDRP